jgi:hypothetical protein
VILYSVHFRGSKEI